MSEVSIFTFNGCSVRTVDIDGEPWWIAKDVCSVLGISNPTMALRKLDDDEKGLNQIETLGGIQVVSCVTEPGLYKLIGRSDRPQAKAFMRWVTHEVLPAIRRTGGFSATPAVAAVEPPDWAQQIMLMLAGKAVEVEAIATKAIQASERTEKLTAQHAEQINRLTDEVADRDLVKRQQYRMQVEHIKTQVLQVMTGRGLTIAKAAHEFWGGVKGRAGVSSVKVENLTVSMAHRLLIEAQRQADIWGISIVVNLPLDLEA